MFWGSPKAQLYGHSSPDEDPKGKYISCLGEEALLQQLLHRQLGYFFPRSCSFGQAPSSWNVGQAPSSWNVGLGMPERWTLPSAQMRILPSCNCHMYPQQHEFCNRLPARCGLCSPSWTAAHTPNSFAVAHWRHMSHSAIGGSLNAVDQLHLTSQPKIRHLQNRRAGNTYTTIRKVLFNAMSANGRLLQCGRPC